MKDAAPPRLETRRVPLTSLILDERVQPRQGIHAPLVREYAQAMRRGVVFTPVDVFQSDQACWVADGFHRVTAAREAGLVDIMALVRPGGLREALFYAAGCNTRHGLRRTNSDKRRVTLRLLDDAEWRTMSDPAIAEHCQVSPRFVGALRKEREATLATTHGARLPEPLTRLGRDGKVRRLPTLSKPAAPLTPPSQELAKARQHIEKAAQQVCSPQARSTEEREACQREFMAILYTLREMNLQLDPSPAGPEAEQTRSFRLGE